MRLGQIQTSDRQSPKFIVVLMAFLIEMKLEGGSPAVGFSWRSQPVQLLSYLRPALIECLQVSSNVWKRLFPTCSTLRSQTWCTCLGVLMKRAQSSRGSSLALELILRACVEELKLCKLTSIQLYSLMSDSVEITWSGRTVKEYGARIVKVSLVNLAPVVKLHYLVKYHLQSILKLMLDFTITLGILSLRD